MELHAGNDSHSNKRVVEARDAQDRVIFAKRMSNDPSTIIAAFHACFGKITWLAVESTQKWYRLLGGPKDARVKMHLVNTMAVQQYDGLKPSGDYADAQTFDAARAFG